MRTGEVIADRGATQSVTSADRVVAGVDGIGDQERQREKTMLSGCLHVRHRVSAIEWRQGGLEGHPERDSR